MTRLRQFAVAAAGCLSLAFGLTGCMGDRPQSVSSNAVMETSGDKTLSWTASSRGKITVYDQNSDKIVYGATVRHGQSVNVDVDNNRILLDSQIVSENSLHRGDEYKIYFEPTSTIESESTVESHTLETMH